MTDNKNGRSDSSLRLRKVAFVAMPFGIKPTGVKPANGPTEVNFDALWDRAISGALSTLGYLPIRADNQTGSMIVKDMLEQLVHADLVLADISIPNGNVYYEAGVRHAARERGCILLRADWANPLFDLAQITQLMYPGPPAEPTDADYERIEKALVRGVPSLCDSVGPVFELTQSRSPGDRSSGKLKEVYSEIFEFQRRLAEARLSATSGRKETLRALVKDNLLGQLPGYALRDLIPVVRDRLHWSELYDLIDSLPEKVRHEDPYFYEQQAHALSKLDRLQEAVALIETIIKTHGETPERLGTLGGRYRELARDERSRQKKRRFRGRAIDAYRRGMQLDLNQYYCAHKLLIALSERGRAADKAEAKKCAITVRAAIDRALSLDCGDEWIDATRATLAFFEGDVAEAQELIDAILDRGWSNWKLFSLARDLRSLLEHKEQQEAEALRDVLQDLTAELPVTQSRLMSEVMPLIRNSAREYEKFQPVHARPAKPGEIIVSKTGDGEETTNTAKTGDYVVKNLTAAGEEYLVGRDKMKQLYTAVEDIDERWKKYKPNGRILAIEIDDDLLDTINVGEDFFIIAPWGSEQLARAGDKLVSPLPKLNEIYRIARQEFDETYRPVAAE